MDRAGAFLHQRSDASGRAGHSLAVDFPETNVRTYVVDRHGLRGTWFFSLDAARLPAVIGARTSYALPYFWAHMAVYRQSDVVRYWSRRIAGPPAATEIDVTVGPRIAHPTELEIFLTARFRLYARRGAGILKADVEHPPWPLRRGRRHPSEREPDPRGRIAPIHRSAVGPLLRSGGCVGGSPSEHVIIAAALQHLHRNAE